jgi:hypothetical protein
MSAHGFLLAVALIALVMMLGGLPAVSGWGARSAHLAACITVALAVAGLVLLRPRLSSHWAWWLRGWLWWGGPAAVACYLTIPSRLSMRPRPGQ